MVAERRGGPKRRKRGKGEKGKRGSLKCLNVGTLQRSPPSPSRQRGKGDHPPSPKPLAHPLNRRSAPAAGTAAAAGDRVRGSRQRHRLEIATASSRSALAAPGGCPGRCCGRCSLTLPLWSAAAPFPLFPFSPLPCALCPGRLVGNSQFPIPNSQFLIPNSTVLPSRRASVVDSPRDRRRYSGGLCRPTGS